jgi:ech hydrogenase subunit F
MSFFPMAATALKNLFSRPATRLYPFTTRVPFAKTRGGITIDFASCILCGICAKRCPTGAISVDKTGKEWKIDHLSCVICTNCILVCPKKCLSLKENATKAVPFAAKTDRTEIHTGA